MPSAKKKVEEPETVYDRARIEALKEAFRLGGNADGPYLDPLATPAEKEKALEELAQ